MAGQLAVGPVQMLVVGFGPDARFDGSILAELQRLTEAGTVRVVDIVFVRRSGDAVEILEANEFGIADLEIDGKAAAALIGALADAEAGGADPAGGDAARADDEVWYVADAIPDGAAAAVVLLEHVWAIPLRDATRAASGELLAEAWIHPLDLAAAGLADAPA